MDRASAPASLWLGQNFPNPFNPSTAIEYTLAAPGRVRLSVFDVLGREIAILADGDQAAGTHMVNFGPSSVTVPLSSGVYILRLTAGDFQLTRRMALIR